MSNGRTLHTGKVAIASITAVALIIMLVLGINIMNANKTLLKKRSKRADLEANYGNLMTTIEAYHNISNIAIKAEALGMQEATEDQIRQLKPDGTTALAKAYENVMG